MPLNISEARQKLPQLVKRTAYGDEEVHLGSHGRDESTLIGTRRLNELRHELEELRAYVRRVDRANEEQPSTHPFAGLEAAISTGRLGIRPRVGERKRRFIPDYRSSTDLSWEEMARLGNEGQQAPRFRRRPRGKA